jgi:hypothetical protein
VNQLKPEVLKIKLTTDAPLPEKFVIDSVNGKPIESLALKTSGQVETDGVVTSIGEVKIKPLAKHFQKGINRFEVSYGEGASKQVQEVILDIQM